MHACVWGASCAVCIFSININKFSIRQKPIILLTQLMGHLIKSTENSLNRECAHCQCSCYKLKDECVRLISYAVKLFPGTFHSDPLFQSLAQSVLRCSFHLISLFRILITLDPQFASRCSKTLFVS